MKVVVSNRDLSFGSAFLKVNSLKEVTGIVGNIDVLIFNRGSDSQEEKIDSINALKGRVSKWLYICNAENVDNTVKILLTSVGGRYFDDEDFFLSSSIELCNLIDSLDEITALAQYGNYNVINDFLNKYLEKGSTDFTPDYLKIVKNATNSLLSDYDRAIEENISMSKTSTEIFSNLTSVLAKNGDEVERLKTAVANMSDNVKAVSSISKSQRVSVSHYPDVSYKKKRSIIRIKEFGDFKYLIPFALGFRAYLDKVQKRRPKLIVCESVGGLIEKRYSKFSWITYENYKIQENYEEGIVFTNYPTQEVLSKLLDDTSYDVFIVVDRAKYDERTILNSKGPEIYAVGSPSFIEDYKLDTLSCISSLVEIPGALLMVPLISNYPKSPQAREGLYLSKLNLGYKKLYSKLGVK